MQSRIENERRTNLVITDRPDSSKVNPSKRISQLFDYLSSSWSIFMSTQSRKRSGEMVRISLTISPCNKLYPPVLFGKIFYSIRYSRWSVHFSDSVPENLTIYDLRRYIIDICGDEIDFPKDWIYLRSVGRCLTKVKRAQEKQMKVKNFRPPIVRIFSFLSLCQCHAIFLDIRTWSMYSSMDLFFVQNRHEHLSDLSSRTRRRFWRSSFPRINSDTR